MRRVILLWSASTVLMLGLFLPLWAQEIPLTSDSYHHGSPQWSPDGNWIVYIKLDTTVISHIYKVSSSGGVETALTSSGNDYGYPQWSPDGNWIAYQKSDATGIHIYKVSSSGGAEIPLTDDSYDHYHPQWSPDGNWIVYHKSDATGCGQIYKVSSGGGTEFALTSDSYHHEFPQWSPDGNWIVYHKEDATGYLQIYKVSSGVGIEESSNYQLTISNYQLSVYPNPFTTKTEIRFQVSGVREATDTYNLTPASLCIYDVSGRLVKNFSLFTPHSSLISSVSWDGKDNSGNELQGGVYFIRLSSGDFISIRKVILVR